MAQFARPTFSSAGYASFRPTYPPALYTHILTYHQGGTGTLLDLGCGPGIVTRPLSSHFQNTIGVDPSANMISTAKNLTPKSEYPSITYHVSSAESLPFIADGSVDVVTAAQAVHWFRYPEWWAEMTRVVRPGGTVAVWGYRDHVFSAYPRASRVLVEFAYGADKLGPFWSQPGRDRVQRLLRSVLPPEGEWESVLRWEFEPGFKIHLEEEEEGLLMVERMGEAKGIGEFVKEGEGLMRRDLKMGEVEDYVRTWSAVHAWKEAHPERVRKSKGGGGDVIDDMIEEIKKVEKWGEDWRDIDVEIEWAHAVVCARRK